jgi:hypothetical protein
MDSIIQPGQFDITKLKIAPTVKALSNGGKTIYVNYGGRPPLVIETPRLYCPYGISAFTDDKGNTKYTLDISIRGEDTDPAMADFKKMLEAMDSLAIQTCVENSLTYFKKRIPMSGMELFHKPSVRPSKDKEGNLTDKYPPTFRMNLPYREGSFGTLEVYDSKRNQLDIMELCQNQSLTKGATVKAIIQCTGMWLSGTGFGYMWKVLQMKVNQTTRQLKGYAFKDDEDADANDEDTAQDDVLHSASASAPASATASSKPVAKAAPSTTYVSDSDDEEEKNEEVEVEVEEVTAAAAVASASIEEEEEEEDEPVIKRVISKPPVRKSVVVKK